MAGMLGRAENTKMRAAVAALLLLLAPAEAKDRVYWTGTLQNVTISDLTTELPLLPLNLALI
jgi:hypothetical protein